ncbi:MAG: methyltransferase domain-containing protein [Cytophagaceae bacterium]|nr:MAG: methyltransferase domain-containing protein [Cytophagaceae bacterium]
MRLTKRMNAIVGYVRPDSTVFDICCDHGLMGLLALAQRNDSEVVFVDQSERALAAVRESLKDLDPSLAARAKVLCTAAETIVVPESPSDFIIAGVGTHTVISIIDHLFSKDLSTHRLILAPQQKSQPLRRYLQKKGWGLVDEHVAELRLVLDK